MNRQNKKIHDTMLIQQLLDYIYSTIELSKYKYHTLEFDNELPKLLTQKYFVSVNFIGFNNFLIFCKIKDKYYTFTIARNSISYNKSKIDYNRTEIDFKTVGLDPSIYNGTIFDGTLIHRHKENDIFIISDVFTFCGNEMTHVKLNDKLLIVSEYLKHNYKSHDTKNTLSLFIDEHMSPIEKTDMLVNKIIPDITNRKVRGITFYPEITGTKIHYLFGNENKIGSNDNKNGFNDNKNGFNDNKNGFNNKFNKNGFNDNKFNKNGYNKTEFNDNKSNNYKNLTENKQETIQEITQEIKQENLQNTEFKTNIIKSNINKNPTLKLVNKTNNIIYAILEMKATDSVDVYKMFAVEKVNGMNGKKYLNRFKMGFAYIAGLEKSLMFREIFTKNPNKGILVKCKFNDNMNKWEPIEEDINAKIPTLITEISDFIEFIEASDDEN